MKAFYKACCYSLVSFQAKNARFGAFLGLSFSLIIGLTTISQAQFQKPEIATPSPNAASLGLYGEVPVSLYTGTPNAAVPLYTLQEGNIKVPITLSYHASGVRVNQHPGWVGLNWNLNAGGAITRKINDLPDDLPHASNSPIGLGYINTEARGLLANTNWSSSEYFKNTIIGNAFYYDDTEPDEFNFNFLGYTGSFYLTPAGIWKVRCDSHLKVELLNTAMLPVPNDLRVKNYTHGSSSVAPGGGIPDDAYVPSFTGFKITTPDGTKYEFGGSTDAVEYSVPFFGQWEKSWIANTWQLTKIVTPEGNTVSFNYAPETGPGKFVGNFYVSLYKAITAAGTSVNENFVGTPGGDSFFGLLFNRGFLDISCDGNLLNAIQPTSGIYDGQLVRPTYLRSIITSNATVNFTIDNTTELKYPLSTFTTYRDFYRNAANGISSSEIFPFLYYGNGNPPSNSTNEDERLRYVIEQMQWRKLTQVEIKTRENLPATVTKINFTYNNNVNERLMLTGVQMADKDNNSCHNDYNFNYHIKSGDALPNYLDPLDKTDHWGFYNKHSLDLSTFSTTSQYDNHKQAYAGSDAGDVLKIGTLKQITYPTSGTTTFDYEPHTAYAYQDIAADGSISIKPLESAYSLGGLRVSSISSTDGNLTKIRTYKYVFKEGGVGSDKPSGILNGKPQYTWLGFEAKAYNGSQVYKRDIFSTQNLLPSGSNSNGSHITYRQVMEEEVGNGNTVFKFTNYQNDAQDGSLSNETHLDEPSIMRFQVSGARYLPMSDKSLERGKLIFKEQSGSTGKVNREEITYAVVGGADEYAPALNAYSTEVCPQTDVRIATGAAYKFYTYKYLPSSQKNTEYDQNDLAKTAVDISTTTYNNVGFPLELTHNRNGKYVLTKNKYSSDYVFPDGCRIQYQTCENSCASGSIDGYQNCVNDCKSVLVSCLGGKTYDEASGAIQKMNMNGMTGILIEQQKWNNDNGTLGMVDGFINLYHSYPATTGYVNIQPEQTLEYAVSITNPNAITSSIGINGPNNFFFKYEPDYKRSIVRFNDPNNAYTLRGEPVQFSDVNNLTTTLSYYNGAKTGLLASKKVALNTGSAQTTLYDYKPLIGLTLMTDVNNLQTRYDYDGFNRLVSVRDHWNNLLQSNAYKLANSIGCPTPTIQPESPVSYTFTSSNSCSLVATATPNSVSAGKSTTLTVTCSGCGSSTSTSGGGSGTTVYSTNFNTETANSTFTTDYSDQVQVLAVGQSTNGNYCAVTDHSGNNGKMLEFHGESAGRIWEKAIAVTSGTTYTFSMWVRPVFNGTPATLQRSINLQVNGVNISSPTIDVSNAGCSKAWIQISGTWQASATGSVPFTIRIGNTSWQNAIAIDDIKIEAGGSSTANTSANAANQYLWKVGSTTIGTGSSLTVTPSVSTTYIVECTTCSGCSSGSVVVRVGSGLAKIYQRVYFIGNSITEIYTVPECGFTGTPRGMAAKTPEQDYVHLVMSSLSQQNPNIKYSTGGGGSDWERNWPGWGTGDYKTKIGDFMRSKWSATDLAGKPDLIIVRLSENILNGDVQANRTGFKNAYNALIDTLLLNAEPNATVVCTNSFWEDQPDAELIIQQVALERGFPFVDLSYMQRKREYQAWDDYPQVSDAGICGAVKRHPGTRGMREIADRILGVLQDSSITGCLVNQVKFTAQVQNSDNTRLRGSKIQGSNDNGAIWNDLYVIDNAFITSGSEQVLSFTNTAGYQLVRFKAGPNCNGDLKELAFYSGSTKLTGTQINSSYGPWQGLAQFKPEVALDGVVDNNYWFESVNGDGREVYLGLRLTGCANTTTVVCAGKPVFTCPGSGGLAHVSSFPGKIRFAGQACPPTGTTNRNVQILVCSATGSETASVGVVAVNADGSFEMPISGWAPASENLAQGSLSGPGTYYFKAKLFGTPSGGSYGFISSSDLLTVNIQQGELTNDCVNSSTAVSSGCVVTQVKFTSHIQNSDNTRLRGSKIQGSNDNGATWNDLYLIDNAFVTTGSEQVLSFANTASYQLVRFKAGPNCNGDLQELAFYSGSTKLTGTQINSSYGPWQGLAQFKPEVALDGVVDGNYWFESVNGDGREVYLGVRLSGCNSTTTVVCAGKPVFTCPGSGGLAHVSSFPGKIRFAGQACPPTGTTNRNVQILVCSATGSETASVGVVAVNADGSFEMPISGWAPASENLAQGSLSGPGTYYFKAKLFGTPSGGSYGFISSSDLLTVNIQQGELTNDCINSSTAVSSTATSVKILPGNCCPDRFVGNTIEGSDNFVDWYVLTTISSAITPNQWYTYSLPANSYRYIRYVAQNSSSFGELLEFQVFSGATQLSGASFGSPSAWANDVNNPPSSYSYTSAFDNNPGTLWHSNGPGPSNYVGLDLRPGTNGCPGGQSVAISSPTGSATLTALPGSFDLTVTACPASGKTVSTMAIFINSPGTERFLGNAILISGTNTYQLSGQSTTTYQDGHWYNNTSGANYGLISQTGNYSFFARVTYTDNSQVNSPVISLNVQSDNVPATSIKLLPGSCCPDRYLGNTFEGSDDFVNWTVLGTINSSLGSNVWATFPLATNNYRYIRYVAQNSSSFGELLEFQVFSGATQLSGASFGSPSAWANDVNNPPSSYSYTSAFDNNPGTLWHSNGPGPSNYVGLDLRPGSGNPGTVACAGKPTFTRPTPDGSVNVTSSPGTFRFDVTGCVPAGKTIQTMQIIFCGSDGAELNYVGDAVSNSNGTYTLSAQNWDQGGNSLKYVLAPGVYYFKAKSFFTDQSAPVSSNLMMINVQVGSSGGRISGDR